MNSAWSECIVSAIVIVPTTLSSISHIPALGKAESISAFGFSNGKAQKNSASGFNYCF